MLGPQESARPIADGAVLGKWSPISYQIQRRPLAAEAIKILLDGGRDPMGRSVEASVSISKPAKLAAA